MQSLPLDRFAVIGQPITQSRSPFIHGEFAAQFGQRIDYQRIETPPTEFATTVSRFFSTGGRGMSVTVPHKGAAFELCEHTSEFASQARAVNTLYLDEKQRLCGENTDGRGLLNDLTLNHRLALKDCDVLIIGAGGAVKGIIGPLLTAQVRSITIANRSVENAQALVQQFSWTKAHLTAVGLTEPATIDPKLVIHASSAGLQNQAIMGPASWYKQVSHAIDIGYGVGLTPYLRAAKTFGITNLIDGLGMLVEQAALAYAIWRKQTPNTAPVIERLRAQLNPKGDSL